MYKLVKLMMIKDTKSQKNNQLHVNLNSKPTLKEIKFYLFLNFFKESFQKEEEEDITNNNNFNYDGVVDYLRNKDFVDYVNARYLMITTMQGFAYKCEARTKFVVPLLFRFLK